MNACGGCTPLSTDPGDLCGDSDCGVWVCGEGELVCADRGANSCGGCEPRSLIAGSPCECEDDVEPGTVQCDETGNPYCDSALSNRCGGCTALPAVPGTPCGSLGCGVWVCAGTEEVVCPDEPVDACGICSGRVDVEAGDPCVRCGEEGEVVCEETAGAICDAPGVNTCGGCTTLELEPGDPCPPPSCGVAECNPDGTIWCQEDCG